MEKNEAKVKTREVEESGLARVGVVLIFVSTLILGCIGKQPVRPTPTPIPTNPDPSPTGS